MSSIGSSALATVQARRFSLRAQGNARKRGGHGVAFSGGRASLYKQMYGHDGRTGVNYLNFCHFMIEEFIRRKSISTNSLSMLVKMEIITPSIEFSMKILSLISMLPIN